MSQFEQRANIQSCLKLGKTAAKMLESLNIVYDGELLKKTVAYH